MYPENTEAAFEYAADLGYDGVELMVWAESVSQDVAAVEWHEQLVHRGHGPQAVGHRPQQLRDAFARPSRDGDRPAVVGGQLGSALRIQVGLVERDELGYVVRADLAQHSVDRGHVGRRIRCRRVDDVDQQVRVDDDVSLHTKTNGCPFTAARRISEHLGRRHELRLDACLEVRAPGVR